MDSTELESSPALGEVYDLANIWRDLASGAVIILGSWYSAEHCFLRLRRGPRSAQARPRASRLEILKRSLLGDSQKRVAIETQVATSTVALMCSESLNAMGARESPSRVPALLVLAAHASSGAALPPAQLYRGLDPANREFVLRAERPDNALAGRLSQAEFAVTRKLVEGLTHSQIAQLRGTSQRTIANQLASTFKKLRVTGRLELMSQLIRRRAQNAAAA